jgi:XTP/dITP diphosphohydrolase
VPFPPRIAIASRNPGKIREILQICADWPVEWVTGPDDSAAWPEVEETGHTYLENAQLKAHAVAASLGIPGLADDSGIEVDALTGTPGVRSARFAGEEATDEDNLRLLIERVTPIPEIERTAGYRCAAVCAWPGGEQMVAEGTCEGTLILEPRGNGGFGYDPIFVPVGEGRTMAELTDQEKNAISHRGRAFRALGAKLAAS